MPHLTCESMGQPCTDDHTDLYNKSPGEHLASMSLFGFYL